MTNQMRTFPPSGREVPFKIQQLVHDLYPLTCSVTPSSRAAPKVTLN